MIVLVFVSSDLVFRDPFFVTFFLVFCFLNCVFRVFLFSCFFVIFDFRDGSRDFSPCFFFS